LAAGWPSDRPGYLIIVDAAEPGGSSPRDYDSLTLFHRSADSSAAPPHYPKTRPPIEASDHTSSVQHVPDHAAAPSASAGSARPVGAHRQPAPQLLADRARRDRVAVGHGITLALAAFGFVSAPSRVVESMIALSILVSGYTPSGRSPEAARSGSPPASDSCTASPSPLLGARSQPRGSLVTELLGFNLGIELTQLIVVVLIMPSLIVLSRTRIYSAVRIALASLGIVLAAAWLAERTTLITSNPLAGVSELLVAHPFVVPGGLAGLAAAAWAVARLADPVDAHRAATGCGRRHDCPSVVAPVRRVTAWSPGKTTDITHCDS
jgi:HupE / UreJ protein